MRKLKFILMTALLAVCFNVTNSCSQPAQQSSNIHGVFAASTPCSEGTRPLPGIPLNGDCDFIIWNLTLYQVPNTLIPTTYKLKYSFGKSQAGIWGFIGGGTKMEMEGKWKIVKGTGPDTGAVIYQLQADKSTSVSFLKLNNDLLHLLDSDKKLMIGNAGYSYTLNRIKDK